MPARILKPAIDLRAKVRDRLGGIPIRPDLEGVLTFDFEQVGDLAEDARDREIVHGPQPATGIASMRVSTFSPSASI